MDTPLVAVGTGSCTRGTRGVVADGAGPGFRSLSRNVTRDCCDATEAFQPASFGGRVERLDGERLGLGLVPNLEARRRRLADLGESQGARLQQKNDQSPRLSDSLRCYLLVARKALQNATRGILCSRFVRVAHLLCAENMLGVLSVCPPQSTRNS